MYFSSGFPSKHAQKSVEEKNNMAAWWAKLSVTSSSKANMCSSCFSMTKYKCLKSKIPICINCSIFEEDENSTGWMAGRSVGYCEPCHGAKDAMKPVNMHNCKPKEGHM